MLLTQWAFPEAKDASVSCPRNLQKITPFIADHSFATTAQPGHPAATKSSLTTTQLRKGEAV